jgi:tetratricopeptide (TPR) repeat protein
LIDFLALSSKARACAGLLVLVLLSGCAGLPQVEALRATRTTLQSHAELTEVPFFPQEDHQCGPAALATVLKAGGVDVTPEALAAQVYLPTRQGSLQVEMLAAARRHGRIAYELAPSLPDVLREVAAGNPVVVLQNTSIKMSPLWHYAVVVGYDIDRDEIIMRSGTSPRKRMPFTAFDFFWHDSKYWAMVGMPPDRLPAAAPEGSSGAAVAAFERLGNVEQAGAAYAAMLARWPESFIALMGLGNTEYARGHLPQAETAFRRATLARPEDAAAFNNLAQTLADLGRPRAALAPARRAVELGGPLLAAAKATLQGIEAAIAAMPPPAAESPPKAHKVRKKARRKKARQP